MQKRTHCLHPAPLILSVSVALFFSLVAATPLESQIFRRIKETAKRAAESEVDRKVDKVVRSAVRCAFDDEDCISKAEKKGEPVVLVDDSGKTIADKDGKPVTDPKAAAKLANVKPGDGAWANYDFVPGDSVLFADDYMNDRVGDFPRRLSLIQGNFELVEWEGQRLLRATANGSFAIPLPTTLPERFTIEFDARVDHGNSWIRVTSAPYYYGKNRGAFKGSAVTMGRGQAGLFPIGEMGPKVSTPMDVKVMTESLFPVRIMADADYMKVYIGDKRVVNAPNAVFPRSDTLYIGFGWALADAPLFVGPIRVAGGGRDLYDRLAVNGRVATQGIFFATGNDRLRPESTPTLKEIAEMLTSHPELRLRIEGHTDNVGDDAANQALSERRAASVKAWLMESAGVEGSRLESAGLGESKPAGGNDTPEGRQQNRRVELVKIEK